jgi:hypothetical protein
VRIKSICGLVNKDLIVYRKTVIIFSLLGINTVSLFNGALNSIIFCAPMLFLTLLFVLSYLTEESKNCGTELLLTTTYTRTDLVVSRYFLCFTILSFQIIWNILFMILISKGSFCLMDSINWYLVFACLFLVVALFMPLTFAMSYKVLPVPIVLIIICVIFLGGGIFYKLKMDGIDIDTNAGIYAPIAFIVSIILIGISILISNKIFNKKDL